VPEPPRRLVTWLLGGRAGEVHGPHVSQPRHVQHPWWQVMCLTGVDYFSTLGYQPGIAALASGALSPIATLLLVLLTLFGALPIYRRVAQESPHGEGSIAMLERLLSWWKGKIFVLCLLGFAATDFIITITLSAADASAHALENPFLPAALAGQRMLLTLLLIAALAAVFLKGFTEAIGIAVALVTTYLLLNAAVLVVALGAVLRQPVVVADWQRALLAEHGSPVGLLVAAVLVFPRLALGLSGFETGVALMPLVRGAPGDTEDQPTGRIRNTQKLLLTAALLMSVLLMASSFVTITLIPAREFEPGGKANGRALAYLAHGLLGERFGTAYDVVTILILWFAGASAMAGLVNLVPRYLPRYGMAPEWTRAARPLVLVFTAVAVAVTVIFRADVDAQGGAYATGVLVLMASAAVAAALSAWHLRLRWAAGFGAIVVVFAYTLVANVIERPEGVRIATFFILTILVVSLLSRAWRLTELRVAGVRLDSAAERFLLEASASGSLRFIAHDPRHSSREVYDAREAQIRRENRLRPDEQLLFLEVTVRDPSDFAPELTVTGQEVGRHRVLRAQSSAVPNAIAAFLLYARDRTGVIPHVYFAWAEAPPLHQLLQYLLFGEGDVAPVAHEVLRRAEPERARRPVTHVA
jgi:hypothetical protein